MKFLNFSAKEEKKFWIFSRNFHIFSLLRQGMSAKVSSYNGRIINTQKA